MYVVSAFRRTSRGVRLKPDTTYGSGSEGYEDGRDAGGTMPFNR
jgi:hypothetical protein